MIIRIVTDNATKVQDFQSFDAAEAAGFARNPAHQGGAHLRSELAGQPGILGLYGPMWGGHLDERGEYRFDGSGEVCIRYEDAASYERLSA